MSEDRLGDLLNHLLDKRVVDAFVEDDAFVLHFDDGSLVELYSENGDLDLYWEMGQKEPQLH